VAAAFMPTLPRPPRHPTPATGGSQSSAQRAASAATDCRRRPAAAYAGRKGQRAPPSTLASPPRLGGRCYRYGAVLPPARRAVKDAGVAALSRLPLPLMSAHHRRRPAAVDARTGHLCAPIVGADPKRVGGGVRLGGRGGRGAAAPSRCT